MITSIEPKAGSWLLLVGPRSINTTMLTAIARLGERGALRVLDGGNRFNAYSVARAARGRPEVMNRITVSRAFTCYQVLSLLESTPAIQVPFVVLDMLSTFYDESVQLGERKRLLRACIIHLKRLERLAGGAVSVHPPTVPSPAAQDLWELLRASATDTFIVQPAAPAPEPMRLF
jgi:ABC-type cobalamin transport system ATPase subunit